MTGKRRNPDNNVATTQDTSGNGDAGARQRKARRRLIQTLAIGGGIASSKLIPAAWTTPIVESALLPAHANTSQCELGNPVAMVLEVDNTPSRIDIANASKRSETGISSILDQLSDALISEALAQDGVEIILTGCYRIVFPCGSNSGMLYASAVALSADNNEDIMTLQAPFTHDKDGMIGPYCFLVHLIGDNSATLRIGPECGVLSPPIMLERVFGSCVPESADFLTDDT